MSKQQPISLLQKRQQILIISVSITLAALAVASFAQDAAKPKQQLTELREIHGEEYSAAVRASNDADRARAAFEGSHSWNPSTLLRKPDSEAAKPEAEKVIAAYQKVLDTYHGTETAAYSGRRLAGFYQYLGQADKAKELTEEMMYVYEHTSYGPNIAFAIGLGYLQDEGKPAVAIEWFRRIPVPKNIPIDTPEKYDNTNMLYLSAQLAIAQAAMEMGRLDAAYAVSARLKEQIPIQRDLIDRQMEAFRKISLHPALKEVDKMIEETMATIHLIPPGPFGTNTPPVYSTVPSSSAIESVPAKAHSPHERRSWAVRAGWGLLIFGIVVSAAGIFYHFIARREKGTS